MLEAVEKHLNRTLAPARNRAGVQTHATGQLFLRHSIEQQPVHPFAGPRDFVRRLYAEQFCNFWRFLFSGGWFASLRNSRQDTNG